MSGSRRDFLKNLGLGAAIATASSRVSPVRAEGFHSALGQPDDAGGRKIGYCIVGLGRISMGQFMPGVKLSKRSRIAALVSGHRPKAERVASQYGVSTKAIYDYEHYEEIAHNPEIDAVYIALPNGMHAEYTVRAAKAGKHVLCEKPMANSVDECEQMITVCRQANRKLMIAYRCRYEPTNLKAVELVRQGYAGKVEMLNCSFGFNIAPGEWRLNKKMAGGGPLVDVGIYCIQATRYLTGEEPSLVEAYSSVIDHDGRFNEVEENLAWNFRFPSGILASCATSYGSNFIGDYARVIGSKGMLELNPAFVYEGLHLSGKAEGGKAVDMPDPEAAPRQFTREADYFAGCILENRQPLTAGEEGLRDARLITAIYRACAEGRPVPLPS
jgi:predicted dehydrogenase